MTIKPENMERWREANRAHQLSRRGMNADPGTIPIGNMVRVVVFDGQLARVMLHQSYGKCEVLFAGPIGQVVPYLDVAPPRTWIFAFEDLRPITP